MSFHSLPCLFNFQFLFSGFKKIAVYTDSEFVIKGLTRGVFKWLINGWQKDKNGGLVIGVELFKQLIQEMIDIEVIWVN